MANPSPPGSTLAAFNAASPQAAERDALACCASGSFAKLIADGRPYRDAAAVLAAVDAAFSTVFVFAREGGVGETHSYSLQQTLYAMGARVLDGRPEIAEVRLSLPNKHHFEVDMSPFGLENGGQVFYAADRPYGLIEGTVTRDDAPPPGKAW